MNNDDSEKIWYLAQLKPNGRALAERNLARQNYEFFCPMIMGTKRQKGRFVKVEQALFPGYIFIHYDPASGPWSPINSTMGIARLVCFDDLSGPSVVPDALMRLLWLRYGPEGQLEKEIPEFVAGQTVRLIDGPFTDFMAKVEKTASKDRIWVLLDLMGQKIRIETRQNQLVNLG